MPSPSCQTDILLKERLEDIITRAKKAKSHAEVPNVGSHLHSPEYFSCFVVLVFSQWFCMVIKWDLCFVCFFAFLVVLHYSHYALDTGDAIVYIIYYELYITC